MIILAGKYPSAEQFIERLRHLPGMWDEHRYTTYFR